MVQPVVHDIYKDISNPLVNTSDSTDTAVGNIISHIGFSAPKHYLICDGAEYNISDYPYLADYFQKELGSINYYGGDGTVTFAVPDMRGEFIRGYDPEHIRDSVGKSDNRGIGKHQSATEHIFFVGGASMGVPGSNSEYLENISGVSSDQKIAKGIESNWKYVPLTQTGKWSKHGLYTSRPTNINVLFCIQFEPINYVVNQYGGFSQTVLFEGSVLYGQNGSLSDSVNNYDFILLMISGHTVVDICSSILIDTNLIKCGTSMNQIWTIFNRIGSDLVYHNANIVFPNETTITMLNNSLHQITKVIGIKGTAPSLLQGGVM